MSRFAILGDEVGEEKSKDKKTSNPKAAVKAAVAAPAAAPVETAAAQKPKKEFKKADSAAPVGGGASGNKEEKDYKKENSKRDNKRVEKKRDPEGPGDRTKKDPNIKVNKVYPGDPNGRAKIIAIIAEKESTSTSIAAAAASDAASDAASENNDVEVIVVPAEPPKKTFADAEAERAAARAALPQPKEGRKAETVKGTVVVNDETKDATARFYNAGAGAKEPAKEKKTKKVFEDAQFGTGDKGTPRPREFVPSTTPRAAAGDRKGKPNANDFGPALSASMGKK